MGSDTFLLQNACSPGAPTNPRLPGACLCLPTPRPPPPPLPGSARPFCELMETRVSGAESCSREGPVPLFCGWTWGCDPRSGPAGVAHGLRSWGRPSQEHRHPQPHTCLVRHISARLHHKTLTRHIKAACQPSGASAGSREPPKPAQTDGKGPDTAAPGYTGSPDAWHLGTECSRSKAVVARLKTTWLPPLSGTEETRHHQRFKE